MAADFADLDRRLKALENNRGAVLRWGTVTETDAAKGSARVRIGDADGLVSAPLRVLQQRTLKDKHQELPDIGEQVCCLFAGQGFEEGIVLGAIYSGKDASPGRPPHVWYRKFEDGTELEYDREAHVLKADVKGRAEAKTEKDIKVEAGTEITGKAGTKIDVTAGVSVFLTAPDIFFNGKIHGTSGDGVSFEAGGGVFSVTAKKFSVNADRVSINEEC